MGEGSQHGADGVDAKLRSFIMSGHRFSTPAASFLYVCKSHRSAYLQSLVTYIYPL